MDPRYTNLYQQARKLESQMHGAWDQPGHSTAQNMQQNARNLIDAIESGQNPDQLQRHAEKMHQDFERMSHEGSSVMGAGDVQVMRDSYRTMHDDFRRM